MALTVSFQSVLIGQIVCPLRCKPTGSLLRGHNLIASNSLRLNFELIVQEKLSEANKSLS